MRTSPTKPPGHVNDWPLQDKNAFVAFALGVYEKIDTGMGKVQAAHAMANELGLEGGVHHWLVDDALAGTFHTYYVISSDHYANADDFIKFAGERDLEHIGAESVAYARLLAGAASDH